MARENVHSLRFFDEPGPGSSSEGPPLRLDEDELEAEAEAERELDAAEAEAEAELGAPPEAEELEVDLGGSSSLWSMLRSWLATPTAGGFGFLSCSGSDCSLATSGSSCITQSQHNRHTGVPR